MHINEVITAGRRIELTRPLVILDLEATGISILHDRIVSICAAKLMPDGAIEVKSRLVNPEMPIAKEAIAVHGITDDDVRDQPGFRQIARSFDEFLDACDLSGFNIVQFDIPLLMTEFRRVGLGFSMINRKIVDTFQIFRIREPRTLTAAVKVYCGEEHENAHDSEADVFASLKVLEGQLQKYADMPCSVDELDTMCNPRNSTHVDWEGKLRWQNGEVTISFGHKRGTSLRYLAEHEPGYLRWILRSDFSDDVKSVVEGALEGSYPEPPPGAIPNVQESETRDEAAGAGSA